MNAFTLDTLKAARRLRDEFGFDERQATGIVETLAEGMSGSLDQLATKADLERFATKEDLANLRAEMATKADLERFATKADLERFATKADLEHFATKADLERFATKTDLERVATKTDLEGFATKADLERFATKAEHEDLRRDVALMRAEMQALENRMTIRLGAMIVASAGFFTLLDRLL